MVRVLRSQPALRMCILRNRICALVSLLFACNVANRFWRLGSASISPSPSGGRVTESQPKLPAKTEIAFLEGLRKVDALRNDAARFGLIPHFGKKAKRIVDKTVSSIPGSVEHNRVVEKLVDAPLSALFRQQVQVLVLQALDRYDYEMSYRPNPYEAALAANQLFESGLGDLRRPDSNWEADSEKRILLERLQSKYEWDWDRVLDLARQGSGKVSLQNIRGLQGQLATVRKSVDSRGAFPWNFRWQYLLDKSPLGFRGQYEKGRSVVEMLLTPTPDPRQKHKLLNKIGPLNLAVAFDALM